MTAKTHFSATEVNFSPLDESDFQSLSVFTCGVPEIDHFFHNEVRLCSKYHYLSPYKCTLIETGEIVGLFTLANDVLVLDYEDKIEFPNLSLEYFDIFTRQPSYPAVNIGHLAVKTTYQSKGIGQIIIEFLTETFSEYRLSGCQFVTVDALNNVRALRFYQDIMGFECQTLSDVNKPTRRMYLDLITTH